MLLKHRQISYLCIGHAEVGPAGDWVRVLQRYSSRIVPSLGMNAILFNLQG